MTFLHFVAQNWPQILGYWFILSVSFLLVWMAVHHESPEARESRRRKERAEAARIHLRRVTAVYVARRQREAGLLITKQGDDVLAQVAREWNLDWYGHGNGTEVDGQPDQAA